MGLKWFKKRPEAKQEIDLLSYGPKLDELVLEVWKLHRAELLEMDNNLVSEAVWGGGITAELTEEQQRIHQSLNTFVTLLVDFYRRDGIDEGKVNLIEYLIRSLIIVKLAYLRDVSKLRSPSQMAGLPAMTLN